MTNHDLTIPVPKNERIQLLDVIRGFALLGVLLMNIQDFSGYGFASEETKSSLPTASIDEILQWFVRGLFEGKFYAIFSILFGIGFSIIIERLYQRSDSWLLIFYRRLFILLILGYIHMQFLWSGDILMLYALLGFLLPLFRKVQTRTLLRWAFVLLMLPILLDGLLVLLDFRLGEGLENYGLAVDEQYGIDPEVGWRTYPFDPANGWQEYWYWAQTGPIYRLGLLLDTQRFPRVLGFFLLGYFIGRKRYFENPQDHQLFFRKVARYGLLIGIPANILMAFFMKDDLFVPELIGLADSISYTIGVVTLSAAYLALLGLAWTKYQHRMRWLAPMGRMALTNYLTQTILGIGIFYSVGFGLGGDMGLVFILVIGLMIFTMQALVSRMWLQKYDYGPMEWIWRKLTYAGWKSPNK